jgi:hypothetical protein
MLKQSIPHKLLQVMIDLAEAPTVLACIREVSDSHFGDRETNYSG